MSDVRTVRQIFVASYTVKDLAVLLRKALDDNGFGDIVVEVLEFNGPVPRLSLPEKSLQKVSDIEFLISDPGFIGLIHNHPDCRLKWAQCVSNGVESALMELKKSEKIPNFILTRFAEGFGKHVAEFVLGRILFRERHFGKIHDLQRECQEGWWREEFYNYRTLDEISVAILGYGAIGQEVARYCQSVGMTVWAIVRDERYVKDGETSWENADHVRPMSRLHDALESCDYLVSILPSTPQTANLLSGDALKPCQRKKTCLINVGRGTVVDEDSVVRAIKCGWLGGAILDVFNQEPLPASSPLWTTPGVVVSPHVSSAALFHKAKQADTFMHNLKCYLEGRPMKNVVDFTKGY